MSVRVRIAPSPTGEPHVGTAYVALFNYVWAKKNGGKFILRIEDTDQVRSTRESEVAIMESLKWVGLAWDEGPDVGGDFGPYRQSERTELYKTHIKTLLNNGTAYRCFCTRERLDALRIEQQENKQDLGYDGHCRDLAKEDVEAQLADGVAHVVRFRFPEDGHTIVPDGLRGDISIANSQIGDQVLIKSDGYPTYHLASVVDDHLMEITDVIRAEEWIPSTPKHVRLYEAFGWEAPRWWHLPLLRNADKSKISKRKNPVSLEYFERIGILPEAMVNFLGNLGWSMPDDVEKFTTEQMIEAFDWKRMGLSGPVFDLPKLEWLNALYIREQTDADLIQRVIDAYLTPERLAEIMPLLRERITRLDGFVPMATYMLGGGELEYDWELLVPKKKFTGTAKELRKALDKAAERLDIVRPWKHETIEAKMRELADELGWKAGNLFSPLRVAVTGRTATPPLFETMEAVGGALCRARIRDAAKRLAGKIIQ